MQGRILLLCADACVACKDIGGGLPTFAVGDADAKNAAVAVAPAAAVG